MSEWCGWPVVDEATGWEAAQQILTDAELSMIELLPSSLSMAQIAVELDIAVSEEARGMMHTIYRKLGASSRRTAVAAAFERRLLR